MNKRGFSRSLDTLDAEKDEHTQPSTSIAELQLELDRRIARFTRWSEEKSKEEIIQFLAAITLLHNEKKKFLRRLEHHALRNQILADLYKEESDSLTRQWGELRRHNRIGGFLSHKSRPAQKAKSLVKAHWTAWKNGTEKYGSQASFAREMAEKYDLLDTGNIENWCRAWKKETTKA